jgi:zinc transporter 1
MNDEKTNKSEKKASMNMHGVFLHVLADALGSIVVIISALVIKFVPHDHDDTKHWTVYIDPLLSIIIIVIITISTIPLFKDTSFILLQTIPKHLEIHQIKTQLLETIPEINGIHELHVWRLTDEKIIASAHLNRTNLSNYMSVADKVKKFFHSIGIHSITIQYECDDDHITSINQLSPLTTVVFRETNSNDANKIAGDCLLRCENEECDTQTCCTKTSDRTSILLNNNNHNNSMEVFAISQSNNNIPTDRSSRDENNLN